MTVRTHAVLGVLYGRVLYSSICTCSAQLTTFHMKRHYRNAITIIIIIISIIIIIRTRSEEQEEGLGRMRGRVVRVGREDTG